jgi:hypothetical protein
VNALPRVLPALGYHTVNDGVWEAICVLELVDDDETKREQKRCTVTVSLVESLKEEEDVLLDGELHLGSCPKPELRSCGYQHDSESFRASLYSKVYVLPVQNGGPIGALRTTAIVTICMPRVQLRCDLT